ncbi:membrane-flanked domain protein [Beutenbergia cavernae DSM 12333]|uniref:Membrane-flanked domain protein n=1 Tax=Beutenbergia cavernae (strain ATCC BAA-8 / DSM 12333 / CCUG 43141 / JCM 11478 / NBRC 16432 / NCIMB 13614 / HKI 0122) TaxID=471853 RepID=C5C1E3_BEUC1|nr:PH domain-containing protein [Beutenbergia cavernae]ACQ81553.1 membrane-flanked domain protein [Beutenbergia cavernae DSM 12333]
MTEAAPSETETADDGVPWVALHRDTLKVTALFMVGVAIAAGVPTAMGVAAGTSWGVALAWVLPGAVLLVAVGTVLDGLRVRFTRYRVAETRVEMSSGILFRRRRSLARDRIRSVDVNANPLQRVFGLVTVKVGTAETGSGSGSATERSLVLDSVARAEGDRLRAELLRRGVEGDGAAPDEQRLATWEPVWLRYAPLSFLTPLIPTALVGFTFQVADWFGRGGLPVEIVAGWVETYGPWPVLLLGFGAFVVLGAIGSLAIHAEAWWNHRLDREPGGTLRVRRGLLVSRSLSLEEERIRGVEIVEPIGIRSARAARLDVVAIGLKTDEGRSDLTTLVPPAPRAVTLAAAEAVVGPVDVELSGHPRAARTRRLRWAAVVVLGLALVAVVVHVLWSPSAFWSVVTIGAALLLAVGAVAIAVDAYASLGHALTERHLVARSGSVRRATVHLDRPGIIGWRIRQSVFQRRMGLMTLEATTAAGRGHYAVVDAGSGQGLQVAADAVPGLLEPFLVRAGDPEPARDA